MNKIKSTIQLRYLSQQITATTYLTPKNKEKCLQKFKKTTSAIQMKGNKADRFASVLIPICVDNDGNLSLLYTRRSVKLRTHVRQISFPGGIRDHADESFEECALRETEEEIGLPRSKIEICGTGSLIKPPHTAAIMPVIGIVQNLSVDELKLNKDEVDEIIIVTIEDLCAPNVRGHTQFKAGYSAPAFVLKGGQVKIWGITGTITHLFLSSFLPKNIFDGKIDYVKPHKCDTR